MFKLIRRFSIASSLLLGLCVLPAFANQKYYDKLQISTLETWRSNAHKNPMGSRLVELLNAANSAIKANPYDKDQFYIRGYIYGTIGCTSWAIADLSRAIEIDPCYAAAYTERAICYLDLKSYQLAVLDLDRAIYLNPRSGDARYARGRTHLELHKPSAALTDLSNCETMPFKPALPGELPGNFYDAPLYYLGVCNEQLGRSDAALRCFKASLRTAERYGGSGYIHRYADQPIDAATRITSYERTD